MSYEASVYLRANFGIGAEAFVVLDSRSTHGEPHRCSVCDRLHEVERWRPAVYKVQISSIRWYVDGAPTGELKWACGYEARVLSTADNVPWVVHPVERDVYATEAEAHEEAERRVKERKS